MGNKSGIVRFSLFNSIQTERRREISRANALLSAAAPLLKNSHLKFSYVGRSISIEIYRVVALFCPAADCV